MLNNQNRKLYKLKNKRIISTNLIYNSSKRTSNSLITKRSNKYTKKSNSYNKRSNKYKKDSNNFNN